MDFKNITIYHFFKTAITKNTADSAPFELEGLKC